MIVVVRPNHAPYIVRLICYVLEESGRKRVAAIPYNTFTDELFFVQASNQPVVKIASGGKPTITEQEMLAAVVVLGWRQGVIIGYRPGGKDCVTGCRDGDLYTDLAAGHHRIGDVPANDRVIAVYPNLGHLHLFACLAQLGYTDIQLGESGGTIDGFSEIDGLRTEINSFNFGVGTHHEVRAREKSREPSIEDQGAALNV